MPPTALVAGDGDIADRVDRRFYDELKALGYDVEVVDDDWQKWAPTRASGKDLILILASCRSGNVAKPFNVAAPVVHCENAIADDWLTGGLFWWLACLSRPSGTGDPHLQKLQHEARDVEGARRGHQPGVA